MSGHTTLRLNDGADERDPRVRGEVKELQAMLSQAGYDVAVDGIFSADTEVSVRRYQRESGLVDDGVVGPDTWESLEMASSARPVGAKWANVRLHDGYANTTPHLRPSVKELQRLLNERGAKLDVDGYFGSKTDETVREFQRRHEIHEYGVVGARTWSALHFARAPALQADMVNEAQAVRAANATAVRESWEWSNDIAVLDKGDRWRVVCNVPDGISIVVEVNKVAGEVVLLERRMKKV